MVWSCVHRIYPHSKETIDGSVSIVWTTDREQRTTETSTVLVPKDSFPRKTHSAARRSRVMSRGEGEGKKVGWMEGS